MKKKKLFILSLVSIIFIALSSSVVFGYFTYLNLAKTTGKVSTDSFFESKTVDTTTNTTTYEIATPNQLYAFSYLQNNGTFDEGNFIFTISNDIDMNNKEMEPIGTSTYPFRGEFNGNGHVISNLLINSNYRGSGFFGVTAGYSEDETDTESNPDLSYIHNFILQDPVLDSTISSDQPSSDPFFGFAVGVLNGEASSIGIRRGIIKYKGIFNSYSSIIGKMNGALRHEIAGDEETGDIVYDNDTGIVHGAELAARIEDGKLNLTGTSPVNVGGIFQINPGDNVTVDTDKNWFINDVSLMERSREMTTFYFDTGNGYLKYRLSGSPEYDAQGNLLDNGSEDYPFHPINGMFSLTAGENTLDNLRIIDNNGDNISSFKTVLSFGGGADKNGEYITFKTNQANSQVFLLASANGSRVIGLFDGDVIKENNFNFENTTTLQDFTIHTSSATNYNILTGFLFTLGEAKQYYIGSKRNGIRIAYMAVQNAGGNANNGFVTPNVGGEGENPVRVSAIDFIYDDISLDSNGNFTDGFKSSGARVNLGYTATTNNDGTITYSRQTATLFEVTIMEGTSTEFSVTITIVGTGTVKVNGTDITGSSSSSTT